jgi:IMP dehydrogenase/GMP reductase
LAGGHGHQGVVAVVAPLPQNHSLDDLLDMITSGLRSAMTYAGASTLPEFHARAVVGTQIRGDPVGGVGALRQQVQVGH